MIWSNKSIKNHAKRKPVKTWTWKTNKQNKILQKQKSLQKEKLLIWCNERSLSLSLIDDVIFNINLHYY